LCISRNSFERNVSLASQVQKFLRVLLEVASAVPGEGKTFTSLNLALSMRLEEDVTVLWWMATW